MALTGSTSGHVDASPDAVFSALTDIGSLPEWNEIMTEVVEEPERLEAGAVWKVRFRAFGQSWVSKSQVLDLDRSARRFTYRAQTDDGNPSFADWSWTVEPDGDGATVTVRYELHPQTFWRKLLLARLRASALRKETRESIAALGAHAARAGSADTA